MAKEDVGEEIRRGYKPRATRRNEWAPVDAAPKEEGRRGREGLPGSTRRKDANATPPVSDYWTPDEIRSYAHALRTGCGKNLAEDLHAALAMIEGLAWLAKTPEERYLEINPPPRGGGE